MLTSGESPESVAPQRAENTDGAGRGGSSRLNWKLPWLGGAVGGSIPPRPRASSRPGTHEVRAPAPTVLLSQAQELHQGGAEPQATKGQPPSVRVWRSRAGAPPTERQGGAGQPAGSGLRHCASPASSPTGTMPRLFSWQRRRSKVKGTLEAKRPGRLGPRPLPSCSWVSQGRLSPLHSRGTAAQPCASQGLPRPRGSAMAGLPGSKVSQDRAWPGSSHLPGAVRGAEWEPSTPASAPTEPHPCSNHQP